MGFANTEFRVIDVLEWPFQVKKEEVHVQSRVIKQAPSCFKMDADEDLDILWCDECYTNHGLDCPILGSTTKIQDRQVETRAFATLPDSLQVKVIDGSRHVVARLPISRRTQFGPLEARHFDGNQNHGQTFYKIFGNKSVIASFDLSDENCCNWMSLVPMNPDPAVHNLVSFQYHGQVYFLASRDIKSGEMLYVWYSPNYAAKMAAAATDDEIQLSSKNMSPEKALTNIEIIKQEKLWSSPSVQGELQMPLVSPGHDASSSKMGETHARGKRSRHTEGDEDYSADDNDSCDDTNIDGSSDEQTRSPSSATFLQKNSLAERETGEDVTLENVMENKQCSVSQDGLNSYCKDTTPSITSVCALHDRAYCTESLPQEGLQEGNTSYRCFLCQAQFLDAELFIRHMAERHDACSIDQATSHVRYPCHLCSSVLPSPRLLQDHMTSQHKGHMINPLKCCKCSKVLHSFAELQQHELKHNSLLSVVCHVCGERFLKGVLDGHLKERHAATDGYVCLQCGCMLSNLKDMTGHVKWHGNCKQGGMDDLEMKRYDQKKSGIEEDKGLKTETGDEVEGHHQDRVSRSEKQYENVGNGVNVGTLSDRLPPCDTKGGTVDQSLSVEGEERYGINVDGKRKVRKRKVREMKQNLEEENRKFKRSKLFVEDGVSERDGGNEGEHSEINNLDDKQEETPRREGDDKGKNLEGKGDSQDNLFKPLKRYNLRQRVHRASSQKNRADQEFAMEGGIDGNDCEEALFKCHLCGSEFQSKHKLNNHLGVHAHRKCNALVRDLPQYPCTECERVFYSSRSLVLHHRRSHKDTQQECQYCDYKCVAMVTLQEHILTKHKEVDLGIPDNFQYPCQDCDLVFLKFFRLTKHMETHLPKQFKCEKCHRFFSRKDGLQYHACNPRALDRGEIGHQKASTHKCKYCQKEFDIIKVLNIHIFTHFINVPTKVGTCMLLRIPANSGKNLMCSYCHGQFHSPSLLVQHVARAHQVNIFPCNLCYDILDSHQSLLEHLQKHAERDSDSCEPQSILESVSTCKNCFAVFPNESTLQRHMTVHLKTKDFICDICGKTFSRKDTLGNHLKSHSSFKPYQCEICGKFLKTPKSFQIHVEAHSEERNFQCYVCCRGFKQKGNLNKHLSRCVPRRDIRCKYCDLKFKDLKAVASHVQHIHSSQQIVDF